MLGQTSSIGMSMSSSMSNNMRENTTRRIEEVVSMVFSETFLAKRQDMPWLFLIHHCTISV